MKKLSNILPSFLAIAAMITLIVISYLNDFIFMDRILPSCFILGVLILVRMRGSVNRVVPEQKNA